MRKRVIIWIAVLSLSIMACQDVNVTASKNEPAWVPQNRDIDNIIEYSYEVKNTYPHNKDSFTQGLIYDDGYLFEGTGIYGESSLYRVDLPTGNILQSYDLPADYFGEGITLWDDNIIQLTWQSYTGFIYNKTSFDLVGQFSYPTQGWGITHDDEHLIMSDGTSLLRFLDPVSFGQVDQIQVMDEDGPVIRLNELEYIRGQVYANVWQTDYVIRIDPNTGYVVGRINLEGLLSWQDMLEPVDVLNGIAYDEQNDRLFVTGKWWPKLFEIELVTTIEYNFTESGWHLISLPILSENNSVADMFSEITGPYAFAWNPVSQQYDRVTECVPGHGYWIYVLEPGTIQMTGRPLERYRMNLETGWNLIAAPIQTTRNISTEPSQSTLDPYFVYDPVILEYEQSYALHKRNGYWIAATQPCELIVDNNQVGSMSLLKSDAQTVQRQGPPPPPEFDRMTHKFFQ